MKLEESSKWNGKSQREYVEEFLWVGFLLSSGGGGFVGMSSGELRGLGGGSLRTPSCEVTNIATSSTS